MSEIYWQQKIVALLHDPPSKVLQIKTHEEIADDLINEALQGLPKVSEESISNWKIMAKTRDSISAAADRINFPFSTEVLEWSSKDNSWIIHPLSGQKTLLSMPQVEDLSKVQLEAIEKLRKKLQKYPNDSQRRFLILWRCLEKKLHDLKSNLCWNVLPADTRIPNHSLLHHNRVASAFVIEKPATLVFSIGPVQNFIATARKTRDLWMGSYLLSYLIWHAIKVIAEKIGPDQTIYPSLLEQPLVDFWLRKEKDLEVEMPSESGLRLATFPNRFTAIVPAEEAESLAKECENAVRKEWEHLAEKVWSKLTQKAPDFNATKEIWQRQIKQFPEVYWAIYEWGVPEKIAELYKKLTGDKRFEELVKFYEELWKQKKAYKPNQGTVYAACHDLAERAFSARKITRDFEQVCEPASKCTICGEREILHDQKDWQGKDFWQKVSQKLEGNVEQEGGERLCAICTVKRFVQPFVFQEELSLTGGFPSTDTISATTFARRVLEKWGKTHDKVRDLIEEIKETKIGSIAFTGMDIPKLSKIADSLGDAKEFLRLDGEWLFTESYERDRLERSYGIKLNDEKLEKLRKRLNDLFNALNAKPKDYYAILLMDGDNMGMWLSGTHEGLAKVEEMLHPKVVEQLRSDRQWQELLKQKRLISPSLHAAISQALANFALHCVPFVVEELHYGRLVYAGGDDLLAFLPIEEVLPTARELRAIFSGEARKSKSSIEVEFNSDRWSGWLDWDGKKLLTMGNKATASIGIVIAHRLHPLRDALQQAREAEEDAKEKYGRNAVCVRWLKRSGEKIQMGAKFTYPDIISDTLSLLLKVKDMIEGKNKVKLSRRFATALMEDASTLSHLPFEAQQAELLRLLYRHSEGDKKEKEKVLPEKAQELVKLAKALDSHAKSDDVEDLTSPQRGLIELAKWLTFIRFLAGDE